LTERSTTSIVSWNATSNLAAVASALSETIPSAAVIVSEKSPVAAASVSVTSLTPAAVVEAVIDSGAVALTDSACAVVDIVSTAAVLAFAPSLGAISCDGS
jgi:hypothetical protein